MNIFKKIVDLALSDLKTTIIGRLASVETKIDGIEKNIGKVEVDVKEIKNDLKQISNRAFKLETATVELQAVLQRAGAQLCQRLEIGPGSPLKLTPFGEELAKRVGAYNFIQKNKELLFSLIDAKNHNTLYDVQVNSRKIFDEILSNSIMIELKNYVYNEGLDISIVLNVVGIILRDEYIKIHPEIK